MSIVRRRRAKLAIALTGIAAVMLTACAAPGSTGQQSTDEVTQKQIDEAMSTPTTIDFWSWVPDIQNEIDLFEAQYPQIDVKLSNQGGATAQYQKLRAAIQSGDVPDVAQIEYSFLPSFTITESVLDLTPYGTAELADQFVESAWAQVAYNDGV